MRVPAAISFFLLPKSFASTNEGRVLMRTGSAHLDRRFNARTDHPMEFKMLTAGAAMKTSWSSFAVQPRQDHHPGSRD